MAIQILVPKRYTTKDITRGYEAPVGPRRKLRGTHIGDLVGLQQSVILCDLCTAKFNPRANHYVSYPDPERPQPCWGTCDACTEKGLANSFIPLALHEAVVYHRRIQGRWGTSYNR